ncbi:hypothetical protein C8P69_103508 [Phreatobacter oligotrophus]|jgi:hypothetical protein|uniref:Beta-barrel assembly complex subunit BamF n=2 Tax=Phreatobacter oligotrophus TaxID=1122261 RepID=A0A2T4ZFA1_9HYPH|nr:hypothetical protein C8P69_103508 [Phreatobacter oligotrophus]
MMRIRTALLATVLIAAGSGAQAQQSEQSIEGRIFGGLLSGLGLVDRQRPPIDYRERAPLVLPRNNALPPPQDPAAARNSNWPNDPDVARARAAGLAERTPIVRDDQGRTLTNSEMRARQNGGWFGGGEVDTTRDRSANAIAGPSTADEMRVAPIWSQVGSLFGPNSRDNQVVPFPGEPPRRRLIEPPPGYRTASPDAPYGPVGRRPDDPQAPNMRGQSGQDPVGNAGGQR